MCTLSEKNVLASTWGVNTFSGTALIVDRMEVFIIIFYLNIL